MYSQKNYVGRHDRTYYAATQILSYLLERLPPIESALDVGCGVGTWLSVLEEQGCDVVGFDGPWVDKDLLRIRREHFVAVNLPMELPPPHPVDFAICLEVAEHLPKDEGGRLVEFLSESSDLILFSAAIPFQGGRHHVNEQWPVFWQDLFRDRGFECLDVVRPRFWNDEQIAVWYRQNAFLYCKSSRLADIRNVDLDSAVRTAGMACVHPEQYERRMRDLNTGRGATQVLIEAFKRRMRW